MTTRRNYFQALGKRAPQLSLALDIKALGHNDYYLNMPFRRSLIGIAISGAFLAAFSIPLVTVGGSIMGDVEGDLFSLVAVLFSLFWMLGWSVGVGVLALVFLAMTFGRETLRVRNNELILRIGIPGIGLGARYRGEVLRHFRRAPPDEIGGTGWRGQHLAVNYGAETIEFGSGIEAEQAAEIVQKLSRLFPQQSSEPPDFSALVRDHALALAAVEKNLEPHPAAATTIDSATPPRLLGISSLALVAANLIPLLGVLFDNWRIGEIMLLFWAESAVIGFYTLLKMWKIGRWSVLFYGPFFVGHYGGFMVVHLLFIYGLFGNALSSSGDIQVAEVLRDFQQMTPALLAFFISHGISYFTNFISRHEYRGREINQQMGQPYKRIIIMHVTIIFGGFLVMALNTPLPALLLLIILKLLADLKAHLSEHAPGNTASP